MKDFSKETRELIALALREDLGELGDVTTNSLIPEGEMGIGHFLAKEEFVLCGLQVVEEIFSILEPSAKIEFKQRDGSILLPGETFGRIECSLRTLLIGERTALNFIQRLSGIATNVSKLVAITNSKITLLDTRKTTPGHRQLEKYAVKVGGGQNHRFGLFDLVMIKNNHIDAIGGDVAKAIKLARQGAPKGIKVEVEVRNLEELHSAISESPEIIMLDNMSPTEVKECVAICRSTKPEIKLEISGGINELSLPTYLDTGADFISLGSLTHSVKSADISFRVTQLKQNSKTA